MQAMAGKFLVPWRAGAFYGAYTVLKQHVLVPFLKLSQRLRTVALTPYAVMPGASRIALSSALAAALWLAEEQLLSYALMQPLQLDVIKLVCDP